MPTGKSGSAGLPGRGWALFFSTEPSSVQRTLGEDINLAIPGVNHQSPGPPNF